MKFKILVFILFFFPVIFNVKALEINSENAILYNLNNDEIIYEKDSEEVIKIASLTKIMTAIVAIENIDDLDETIIISNEMLEGLIEQNASVAGFKTNDKVTYKDLLYGVLLSSGADATQALALSISGSVDGFVNLMNEKSKQLNLKNTHFTNTTGLDNKNNYSTVKDVASILKYALNNETFKQIFETRYYKTTNGKTLVSTIEYTSAKYNLDTTNIKGAKTGTTTLAGLCLASISNYNNINYLLVTAGANKNLNKPLNIIDANNIYNYYFDSYNYYNLINKNEPIVYLNNDYSKNKIEIKSNLDYYEYMLKNDYENLEFEYVGKENINIFTKDKIIGKYNIILNGNIIKTIDIYKPETIDFNVFVFIGNHIYVFLLIILIPLLFIFLLKVKKHYVLK